MKNVLLILTLLAASSPAQETPPKETPKQPPVPQMQRIVEVKHVSPDRIRGLLSIFGVMIQADSNLKLISLSGPAENVKAAEDAIRRLDVPASFRNVESTFYILMASQKGESGKLPAELESTIKQLRTVSAYQSYRLLDTILLRSREGRGSETSGAIPSVGSGPLSPAPPGTYHLRVGSIEVDPDPKGGFIAHLTDLRFGVRVPVPSGPNWQFTENGINTSVDVREGQKVVIGKANVDGGESALILVVTVKVAD